jgi:hypothetical protein
MLPRIFRFLFGLMIACVIPQATVGIAQEVRDRSSEPAFSYPASDNVHELCVGIMGEVDTPGTYRLSSSSLKLHRLLKCAQGFTADSSRAIRVIRMGRVRQTEIFSETVDSPLMPGDLLIVESKRSPKSARRIADSTSRDSQTIRAIYEEGTIRSGVQIALINVLEYPVVLRLRPDQANASYIVQALGQPISLLANTHIITPDVPRRQTSDAAKRATRMEEGSVMVFEPGKVEQNRLPVTLPKPLDTDIQLGSQNGLMGLRHRHVPELRNLGHHPFWSNSDPFDSSPRTTRNPSLMTKQPEAEVPDTLAEESGSELVETDAPIAADSVDDSTLLLKDSISPDDEISEESALSIATLPADTGTSRRGFSSGQQIFILITFGLLILIAAMWHNAREKNASPGSAGAGNSTLSDEATIDISKSLIGGLVEQQSRLHQGQITFPIGMNIPGRIATSKPVNSPVQLAGSTLLLNVPNDALGNNGELDDPSEGVDMMTIPIRPTPDFSVSRSSMVTPKTADHSNESDLSLDSSVAPTPLARALRQLEKRRSA